MRTRRLSCEGEILLKLCESLYDYLYFSAYECLVGTSGVVAANVETALKYGVCALKYSNEDRKYQAVVADPLLIAALKAQPWQISDLKMLGLGLMSI